MKTIYLPAGTDYVQFDELAHKIASALHPLDDSATDGEMMAYGGARINLEAELLQAAKSGALPVKDPLTFGPHSYPRGNALQTALVSVNDLRIFLAGRPIAIESEQAQAAIPSPASVGIDEIAFDMVATRKELIDAFGKFTGMSLTWFDNLNDSPKLKAARKYTGQGGRHSAEPLFCPYEVMQWLADPKRKKGKQLNDTTAWRLLKENFGKVYNLHSIGDPNAD